MSKATALAVSDRPTRAGRDPKTGHWLSGNSGRPPGIPNKTDLDLREIKRAVVASWKKVDGPRLLRQLARKNPEGYIRLVVGLLPRDLEHALQPIAIVVRDDKQRAFAEHVKRRVEQDGLRTNEAILEALAASPVDLDFDCVVDAPTELDHLQEP